MTAVLDTRSRPGRWLVGLVAGCLATNVAGAGVLVVTRSKEPPRVHRSAVDRALEGRAQPADDPRQAVERLLERRAYAVRHRDVAGFLATVDPLAPPAFRRAQRSVAGALGALSLGTWEYDVSARRTHQLTATRAARYRGARTWSPEVLLSYRLAGFDDETTTDELYPTFVERSGRWYLGADDDFADQGLHTQRGPWDFGPLRVTRSRTVLVLSHPGSDRLARQVAEEVSRDIPRVDAVWKRPWAHRAVVVIPSTQRELEQLVGETGLDQIAAVATAESTRRGDGSTDAPVGDRVMVNPLNFDKLGPIGRRVVLTHELTHVATRAVTAERMPSWLVEGFADYVGYLGAGVPVRVAAGELADDLRAGKPLRALPADADFGAKNPRLAQAYEQSWLAARFIADQVGPAGLAALYAAVGEQSSRPTADPTRVLSAALRATLRLDLQHFVSAWRGYVRRQLT